MKILEVLCFRNTSISRVFRHDVSYIRNSACGEFKIIYSQCCFGNMTQSTSTMQTKDKVSGNSSAWKPAATRALTVCNTKIV